ncbi:diguanylate cyclase (GGDEF)-like protein [Salibacterium salarium]|uniref:sensor domain-containing diguanylate cyclase n=1 Tax=Salibacterium salarium TaxID=284579 RepID=UPI00278AB1F1|nr:diguanylate cyclase [Salibacterium salarium]MDQ0298551.1 diguanylate cyclase (GGDEF)-like protein [Salibacterium salarium]
MKKDIYLSEEEAQYREMWENVLPTNNMQTVLGPCIFYLKDSNRHILSTFHTEQAPNAVKQQAGLIEVMEEMHKSEEKTICFGPTDWKVGIIGDNPEKQVLQAFLTALVPSVKRWLTDKAPNLQYAAQKRNDLMIQVTKKFHSSMKADAVLKEIVKALEFIYPSSRITLHLAQDWEVHTDLAHIDCSFGFHNLNEKMKQTYLVGQMQVEETRDWNVSVIYIPLRGKQGVYGVLSMEAARSLVKDEKEREYIKTLADTGGNALENAELYQQSRTLIKDLQLINETSHILNSRLKIEETVQSMQKQIKKFIPESQVGFILIDDVRNLRILNDSYFNDSNQLETIYRVMDRFERDQDSIFISDLNDESAYQFSGYRSMMAGPMKQSGELKGAVIVLGEVPNAFTFHQFKLMQSLIHHSTLAFMNAVLHEKLETLVITDHLTKLHSRHHLDECVRDSLNNETQGTFLLFDIDNFKNVNDNYGHQTGDSIIIQVGRIIEDNIRSGDVAARWGGEELAVYLPQASADSGWKVAERIVKNVEEASAPPVTISCGATTWEQEEQITLDDLFQRADQALYQAKRSGKNQVVYEMKS